jgi:hypothetical protein
MESLCRHAKPFVKAAIRCSNEQEMIDSAEKSLKQQVLDAFFPKLRGSKVVALAS